MKLILCSIVCSCISLLSSLQAAESRDEGNGQQQIDIAFRIVEMPASDVKQLFGKKGAAPGGDMTEDMEQRLAKLKSIDVLSAPRVVTRPGQSAQIKVCQEMQFATSFRVVETNGAWEPVMKTVDSGISITVIANPYPHDPERLHGSAEVLVSQLDSVSEQTVTPPGSQSPLKLQSPVVSSRVLTASFDVTSGQTIVLGGLQSAKAPGDSRTLIVLMRASVIEGNVELVAKLKNRVIPSIDFDRAPLGDVLSRLSKEAKDAGISLSIVCSSITQSGDKISVHDAKGVEPSVTLSMRDVSLYDLLRYVAKLAGATVTFEQNSVAFSLP